MPISDPVTIEEKSDEPPIPPALLVALGDEKPVEERYGQNINNLIASRWEATILNDSEEIKDILKQYKIPKNCPLLEAPELNAEVKVALTDSARNRDQMLQDKQQQLGIALTCLGQAMTKILAGQEISEALKMLTDGTKLLTSLHHRETNTRKQLLAPLLDKSFIKMAETIPRNKYLFGENLAENIKNTKEIERSGLQLRKPKPPTFNRPGNWTGPPRQNQQPRNTTRGGQKRPPVQLSQTKKMYQPPKRLLKRAPANRPERDYQRARQRR